MHRRSILSLILAISVIFNAETSAAENGSGESELLFEQNQVLEKAPEYAKARENAELRGLASFSLEGLLERFDRSEITSSQPRSGPTIIPSRSLYVRELALLEAFSFSELMDTLAVGTDTPEPAGLNLFRDWWRTAAPPESGRDIAIGCTDKLINGLDYLCPETGGLRELADIGSFEDVDGVASPFQILALINRGDLWNFEKDSTDCGEYRVIAGAKNNGLMTTFETGIYLFIFEAILRRGENGQGFCKAVQKLWASFSTNSDDDAVASWLRSFYLKKNGLTVDGQLVPASDPSAGFVFGPIMSAANLGLDGELPEAGQIRTNTQFETAGTAWHLREYRFRHLAGTGLRIIPVGLAATPPVEAAHPEHPLNQMLANELQNNIEGIDTVHFDKVTFKPKHRGLEAAEAIANDRSSIRTNLQKYFKEPEKNDVVSALRNMTNAEMTVRKRANNLEFTTCIGCHNTSGIKELSHLTAPYPGLSQPGKLAQKWKSPMSFHFARFDVDRTTTRPQFYIGPQLSDVFIPKREYLMRTVLEDRPPQFCAELSAFSRQAFASCSGNEFKDGRFFDSDR